MQTAKLALILAAGNGSRLASRSGECPKPLVNLNGRPLLEYVMSGARGAGIERFVIVLGYRGQAIKEWYESHPIPGVQVTWIENPDYRKDNGISVLRAKSVIHENFLLLMADHIFEPETARSLLRQPLGKNEVVLAIDRNIGSIFDLDDATKVRLEQDYVVEIGKSLQDYNALDTGMFLCGKALFGWLERAAVNGNCSLSDGLRLMAQYGKFKGFDIGDAHWQDVDTPAALDYAQQIFSAKWWNLGGIVRPAYV
jgi:1L-myo-inositol 1-phosphate cytidylyltransferase